MGCLGQQIEVTKPLAMPSRHFPPPWSVEEQAACFTVRDANGQALASISNCFFVFDCSILFVCCLVEAFYSFVPVLGPNQRVAVPSPKFTRLDRAIMPRKFATKSIGVIATKNIF
jgi:hypothetical protein